MFGSDDFPLGPNGQFPRQRISSYGNEIAAPEAMEEVYGLSGHAKLPVVERDFHSSLNRVKGKMKMGRMMREGQDEQKFRPRGRSLRALYNKGLGAWFGPSAGLVRSKPQAMKRKRWVNEFGSWRLVDVY